VAKPPFPAELVDLLTKPNPAVMATVRADGTPVTVATWYLLEDDGRILLNLSATRKRLDHLRRDPRLSLTVLDEASWYRHLSMQGTVIKLEDDPDLAGIDRLAMHYNGRPYGNRHAARVNAWMDVESYHYWGE